MNLFQWIEEKFRPAAGTSDKFFYDDMESQSGFCLPLIYKPFDVNDRSHWIDRGLILDFAFSAGRGRTLDLGPGDGWPSLPMAPFVNEVWGVDPSLKRIETCRKNALRMSLENAKFKQISSGEPLPFDDEAFDGATAASSVEQSPDPIATLREINRVLKKGGRLRINYESLDMYRNGKEVEYWLDSIDKTSCRLIIYNRKIDEEIVDHYSFYFSKEREILSRDLKTRESSSLEEKIRETVLEHKSSITKVLKMSLHHPSGPTFIKLLKEAGFTQVFPTNNGGKAAAELYDRLKNKGMPQSLEELDEILTPEVLKYLEEPVSAVKNPMITAVK